MPTPHGAVGRTLADLTIGVAKSMRKLESRNAEIALQETTQQYQLALQGTATTVVAWDVVEVSFDYEFYYAPGQRDSDLERPQFYFGADVAPDDEDADAAAPVAVIATVTKWNTDVDNGATVGATVAIGVFSDNATTGVAFLGVAHLSFQGFTALVDPEDIDFPDVNDS